jgi:nitroreductase
MKPKQSPAAELKGMSVSEAVWLRRAIKQFDPQHTISEEQVSTLLQYAILSPTAFNIQHWRFLRIIDRALREEIQKASSGQPQVTDASVLLILCMDLKAWQKNPRRYWPNAPTHIQDSMIATIERSYKGNIQAQRDEGMRSCSFAAMTLMLVAKEMGYDSCPLGGFDSDAVGKLIKLPPDHAICMMVAIGKAIKDPRPRAGQLSLEETTYTNQFPAD